MWGRNFSLTTLHRPFYTSWYKRVKKFHLEIERGRRSRSNKVFSFSGSYSPRREVFLFLQKNLGFVTRSNRPKILIRNPFYHSVICSTVFRENSVHSWCVFSLSFFHRRAGSSRAPAGDPLQQPLGQPDLAKAEDAGQGGAHHGIRGLYGVSVFCSKNKESTKNSFLFCLTKNMSLPKHVSNSTRSSSSQK